MINLELPESLEKMKSEIKAVASGLLRPIARKYDEVEHVTPEELEVLRRRPAESSIKEETDGKKEKKESGTNLITVISLEAMCWGDVPLTSAIPGSGFPLNARGPSYASLAPDTGMVIFLFFGKSFYFGTRIVRLLDDKHFDR